MGNKVLIKPDIRVAFPMEQFIRYLHYCGLPKEDVDFLYDRGEVMEHILLKTPMRMTQFTGSSKVADHLCKKLGGKVKVEDAGYDWKVLGPDVPSVIEQ